MLTNTTPAKKLIISTGCALLTCAIVKSKFPIKILNKAYRTFYVSEENPFSIGGNFKSIGYSSSLRYKVVQ